MTLRPPVPAGHLRLGCIAHKEYPSRLCAECGLLIPRPTTANQRRHPGKCAKEWKLRKERK